MNKIHELEDSLNQLNYVLWDTKYCCITSETIDLVREVVKELLIENRIAKDDLAECEEKKSVDWNYEHLV